MQRRTHAFVIPAAVLTSLVALATSGLVADSAGAASKPSKTLTILVTNDDGVTAPGINATVQALTALPHTKVTVVAPLANQSGTGAQVTGGPLTVTDAKTAHGYPAKAVTGYPADTIIWAIDDHGVPQPPDLVVSGINLGQNIGPLASLSGTVGAAQTALARGIPALAVSQGVDNGLTPDFAQGARYLVAWVQAHRNALVAAKKGTAANTNGNLNVPTCAKDTIRGPVNVALGTTLTGYSIDTVNCSSTATKPKTDVQAFVDGFASLTPLHPVNPPQ
jgi:5'-nucleotidase